MRILVVGGGIGGVTAAGPLAKHHDVTLIDKEPTLAFHTTGRSAAMLYDTYGGPDLWALTRASRTFFDAPPPEYVDHSVLEPRGTLAIGTPSQLDAIDALYTRATDNGVEALRLDGAEARKVCPALGDAIAGGVYEPSGADMDVASIHQAFVRMMRRNGAAILPAHPLVGATYRNGQWTVDIGEDTWTGDVIVNAAGAWGDVVAQRCGVEPVGLQPMRRTVFMVDAPPDSAAWPLVDDIDSQWYFKPDGPQLLCSLAEETPVAPADERPREIDIALAIERINDATTLGIRHVRSSWAGQRTFAPDRTMVIGLDADQPAFCWLVGQGGTGIQTGPAAGELAAAIVAGNELSEHLLSAGVDPGTYAPGRLRTPQVG